MSDMWSDWVLRGRCGGDAEERARLQPQLEEQRDRVLDQIELRPGVRLADIGCGDGLLGFGALARSGNAIEVLFSDVSPALVEHCRERAEALGVGERCSFLTARAEALDAIPAASVDVVAARAVLTYLPDKTAALREFFRILRPGGCISLCDPIIQDKVLFLMAVANRLRSGSFGEQTRRFELLHRWQARQFPNSLEAMRTDPVTNFNERDLFTFCENAGFSGIRVRLELDKVRSAATTWAALLETASLPGYPTLGEILQTDYTADERAELERLLTAVLRGDSQERRSTAYVFAVKGA